MYRVKSSGNSRNTAPVSLQPQQHQQSRAPLWPARRRRQRLPISRPTGIAALLRLRTATSIVPASSVVPADFATAPAAPSTDTPSMATTLSALPHTASSAVAIQRAGDSISVGSVPGMDQTDVPMSSLAPLPILRVSTNSVITQAPGKSISRAIPLTAAENLLRIRAAAPVITMRMVKALINSRLPLLQMAPAHDYVAPLAPSEAASLDRTTWYVLGDVHGDFFALHTLLSYIKAQHTGPGAAGNFRILLLGDMVDRGLHDMETLLLLLDMAMEFPHRVLWLAGNHDDALYLDSGAARFEATVSPSEFKDKLNNLGGTHPFLRALGYLLIAVAARLPRAVLFPDGTLATHAGFPLRDVLPEVKNMAALNSPACLHDFLWSRATPHARRKTVRRHEGCATFGYEDFSQFCQSVQGFFPVQRMVRGHDHVELGYHVHETYRQQPVLTLNSFGHDAVDSEDRHLTYKQRLCLGVMQQGRLPRVDLIPYGQSDFRDYMSVSPINLQNAPPTWPTDSDEKNATRQRRAQIAPTPTPLPGPLLTPLESSTAD
ncbi:MAG TPA: metallophosphoesterase family protein [Candidatus Methylacidiphilales bacterium]|nr:metallophosphoesterase family protein [Candidatus Methylacidiphilales bacterium]